MTILIMNLFKDKLTICAQTLRLLTSATFCPVHFKYAAKTEFRQQSQAFTLD